MKQQTTDKAEVVVWELGQYGVVTPYGTGWKGYAVGAREEAYAELERLEGRESERGQSPDVRH
jgi:hypothetical protein